jgi:SOS-response transcriptional repressor LexA
MEPFGKQIRRKRLRLVLTLDEVAAKSGISKPYLSLIETGRVPNPPADEKLRRLEGALGFEAGALVAQAHWMRTPADVRSAMAGLVGGGGGPVNLDRAYLSGLLHELADKASANVEPVGLGRLPVINQVAAGYPTDFTDLDYPRGVADDYIPCPDLSDPNAFAARVVGDSMAPAYRAEDVVVFSPSAQPRSGDDCFVRFEDGRTTFKRVYFEQTAQGEAAIRLEPRNSKYRTQVMAPDKVTGVYRAVFKYQRIESDEATKG